ncbi:MAG: hypothetical protein HFE66_07885 [Clostridiales bacterium]|nr:hypothetical protein [Clostridiales bacterium]
MKRKEEHITDYALRYPVVLIHGVGYRQGKLFNYWGRIPKYLEARGAKIFYTSHDAWGALEHNGEIICRDIKEVLDRTGAEKINIIAHSNGGIEARYAISSLGMAPYVASLTTICTCHHGSYTIDRLLKFPVAMFRIAAFFVNCFFRLLGDKKPDFQKVCNQFSTTFCKEFNMKNPNIKEVVYASYGAKMKSGISDLFLMVPFWFVRRYDGDNDGLVSVESSKWGDFKGVLEGTRRRGVSHADAVDARRHTCKSFDICSTYVNIIRELAADGL